MKYKGSLKMIENIDELIVKILPEIIEIRRKIHETPELKYAEFNTVALVANKLQAYGYQVQKGIGKTGLIALLDSGKPGKTVGLRADMDALPITEDTSVSYKSKNLGKMYACGHDGHTATLLAVAWAM